MKYKSLIIYTLATIGSLGFQDTRAGDLEGKLNRGKMIKWGVPTDCYKGRICKGEVINSLVREEDCCGEKFVGEYVYTIELPEGQLPTRKDFREVMEGKFKLMDEGGIKISMND